MLDDQTDTELVKMARADDKDAFNLLLERYQLMAHCVALRLVANEEIARELLQEAMLQAYLSLDRLRDETLFKNWFYGIVLNVCRNWRRQPRIAELPLDATAEHWLIEIGSTPSLFQDPQEILEEQELQQLVREAVTLLTPKNRTVALLFYYECLPMQEIARQLNISLAAVKNRLLKAREQLRSQLKSSYPDMMYTISRKRKGGTMLKMTLARVCALDNRDLVILQDEQRQRVLPLWLKKELQGRDMLQMGISPQSMTNEQIEPLTIDLLTNLLQAMGGTIDKVSIEVLQDNLLYAQLYLRSQNGTQKIKARLNDALPLAIRTNSPLVVASEVLEQLGQRLADQPGDTVEQQLDALVNTIGKSSYMAPHSQSPIIAKVPRNLDFSAGLQGWWFIVYPKEVGTYAIDTQTRRSGRASLALTTTEATPFSMVSVHHEGFQADDYQGKRLRMIAYARTEDVKRGVFSLMVHGVNHKLGMTGTLKKPLLGTTDWTRYELVLDVPNDAVYINFSLQLMDQGKVWLDEVEFTATDDSVPLTEDMGLPYPLEPQNMYFAYDIQHWDLWGSHPQDYERGIDNTATAEHTASGYLRSAVASPRGNGMLRQTVRAKAYTGKCVSLSGKLKTAGVEQQASLYIQLDGAGNNNVVEKQLERDGIWQTYSLTCYIPEGCHMLRFGVILYGKGTVWLEKMQLREE